MQKHTEAAVLVHTAPDGKIAGRANISAYFMKIEVIEVNPFAENTCIAYDETGECVIIDPGCYTAAERERLRRFIHENGLKPVRLLNTHCHLDHVFADRFVHDTWGLGLEIHPLEQPLLERFPLVCQMYGVPFDALPPAPAAFLQPGSHITFGNTTLHILFTPGHSPGSVSFWCEEAGIVVTGDALFYESIGRTDLPGGNHAQLLDSIRRELFSLPDATVVYPGHGPVTTIRHEKEYNPFL